MEFKNFGLNVAKQRIKKNLSAYELSLRLGKDQSYINKLENGKINIAKANLITYLGNESYVANKKIAERGICLK